MSGVGLAKKGFGAAYKAFKKGASKIQDKADKHSEKMIKEMNSPKILDKVKGYLKLGGLTAGTAAVMPSTVNKDKKNKGKKRMRKKFGNGNIVKGGLGAQSVKYGLDTNYDITAADPKARFIAKNKKAGGGMIRQMYKKGKSVKKGYHRTKDGRMAKKGLYYYMNRRKKAGTSRKGKGTVTDKALKRSAKTAKA